MGAEAISTEELTRLEIEIVQRFESGARGLLIPDRNLDDYRDLIRRKLTPGFWNETVSRSEVFFQFKLEDGTLKEFVCSPGNRKEIASLCAELNNDPIEKTSDIPRYLGGNQLYRELMIEHHGARDP